MLEKNDLDKKSMSKRWSSHVINDASMQTTVGATELIHVALNPSNVPRPIVVIHLPFQVCNTNPSKAKKSQCFPLNHVWPRYHSSSCIPSPPTMPTVQLSLSVG